MRKEKGIWEDDAGVFATCEVPVSGQGHKVLSIVSQDSHTLLSSISQLGFVGQFEVPRFSSALRCVSSSAQGRGKSRGDIFIGVNCHEQALSFFGHHQTSSGRLLIGEMQKPFVIYLCVVLFHQCLEFP